MTPPRNRDTLEAMSSPTIWSAGRYDAVGDRIAPIAAEVVAAVGRRRPLSGAAVADLACGTGSAALAAAAEGARVTAVDITPELLALGEQKADAAGRPITWVAGDASDTGLPGASFDAAVSNMGIIFVEPPGQVAEIARLLVPGGILGFSSWARDPGNPFFSPIVAVLGPPPESAYSPDQWGAADMITDRLAADFDDVEIRSGTHTWQLGTVEEAVYFVTHESPMHVSLLGTVGVADRGRLRVAFEETMRAHAGADGSVSYDSPYVVVTASRR
jgi:SAM-dependent methyltransferase